MCVLFYTCGCGGGLWALFLLYFVGVRFLDTDGLYDRHFTIDMDSHKQVSEGIAREFVRCFDLCACYYVRQRIWHDNPIHILPITALASLSRARKS